MKKAKLLLWLAIAIVPISIAFFGTFLNFITDYLWFEELGYTQVYMTKLVTQLKVAIPTFLVLTILLYTYLRTIKKDYYKKVDVVNANVNEKRINQIALGASVGVSLLATLALSTNMWFDILRFINSTSFNISDPIFNQDLSFYIFKLPFLSQIYSLLIMLIIILVIMTGVFYLFLMSVRRPKLREVSEDENPYGNVFRRGIDLENGKELLRIAVRQLTVLGFLFFVILGAGYFLKQYDLLYSTRGVAYGASYTDIHVTLWVYRVMIGLSLLSAILFAIGMTAQKFKLALAGPVLMIIVSIVGNVGALAIQNLVVSPDEISKESEYLRYNMEYTRMAYGLNDISEKDFPVDTNLSSEDIDNNVQTIENIRINDYSPTTQFYNQRQGIRQYYKFNDVDIDRYMINGKYTQTFIGVREIDEAQLAQSWINQHLKYTHGYGVAMSPVNSITVTGQPELLIQNLPPRSSVEEIEITRPEIYFGERTNNYIITNTDEAEFDYPSGDNNVETFYEGSAGINLGGINRLLFSIRQRSMKMFVSSNLDSDSKILIYRNIHERIRKIAPFLQFDADPYIVTSEGKIYWIIDGYSTSANYPYAEPYMESRTNYIRNSVKVVVDAFNGETTFYLIDENDPVAATLGKIFPELLKPIAEMSDDLKVHLRYPQTLFNIQSQVYRVYHVNNTTVFYQGEDRWDIANQIYGNETVSMDSIYTIMKLPDQDQEEFILSIPYTPRSKPNMAALFVARNDGENYGELVVYKLPKQVSVYGPMQIESKIDQHTEISKEFSLWASQGSSYIRGNVLSIPIENSLIYVEPIYLQAANENSLPEVKRVIVVFGDRIAYRNTLKEALEELFGETEVPGPVTPPGEEDQTPGGQVGVTNIDELIILANEAFQRSEEAQKSGDWASYGRYLNELQNYLEQLESLTQTQ